MNDSEIFRLWFFPVLKVWIFQKYSVMFQKDWIRLRHFRHIQKSLNFSEIFSNVSERLNFSETFQTYSEHLQIWLIWFQKDSDPKKCTQMDSDCIQKNSEYFSSYSDFFFHEGRIFPIFFFLWPVSVKRKCALIAYNADAICGPRPARYSGTDLYWFAGIYERCGESPNTLCLLQGLKSNLFPTPIMLQIKFWLQLAHWFHRY